MSPSSSILCRNGDRRAIYIHKKFDIIHNIIHSSMKFSFIKGRYVRRFCKPRQKENPVAGTRRTLLLVSYKIKGRKGGWKARPVADMYVI